MGPHAYPAGWIEAIGWFSVAIALASALAITVDIAVLGYRQKMPIMNPVYPVTALYWGPVAAGCTLGDIAGEWLVLTPPAG